jgi:hypothetical protein
MDNACPDMLLHSNSYFLHLARVFLEGILEGLTTARDSILDSRLQLLSVAQKQPSSNSKSPSYR